MVPYALRSRVEELARGESPVRRSMWHAVGLSERAGLFVRAVKNGSAADRAGIEGGDLLVTAAGRSTTSSRVLPAQRRR
jgi:S1-C subfamily serine protease